MYISVLVHSHNLSKLVFPFLNINFTRDKSEFFMEVNLGLLNKGLYFNTFSTNVPLLYTLKTSENPRFSDVFRGYRSGKLVENGLRGVNTSFIADFTCLQLLQLGRFDFGKDCQKFITFVKFSHNSRSLYATFLYSTHLVA